MSGTIPDNALLAWLQDEQNDPFGSVESITGMYTHFSTARPNPIDALQQDDRNHCFLVFVENANGDTYAQVLHHLAQYPARLGAPATTYDRHWYLTVGQPIGGSMITIDLPGDLFGLRAEASVFTPERIQRELGNNPEATQLEVDENDIDNEDVETFATRRGMWLPNSYAALCLGEQLTPVDVWNRLYSVIVQNGHLEACSLLIRFLQYQMLGSDPDNHALYQEDDLTQPNVTPAFLRHRAEVLSDLTGPPSGASGPTNTNAGSGGTGLSAADLQALIQALCAGHTAPAPVPGASTSSSTTVDKRWLVNLDSLLKFCMVQSVSQLTPVWSALAKGPKKEERTILQAALDDHARSPGAATSARLTVTKELLGTVVGLVFWAGNLDMLEEGLHPFRTLYTSTTKQAQDQAKLRLYDSLAQGSNLRLEDVELFQLVLRSNWPSNYRQLDTSVRFFQNLITVLLSSTHPLVIAHKNFLKSWSSLDIQLGEYFASDQAKPSLFLRSLQLRIATYWQQVSMAPDTTTAVLIPAPDFQSLLSSLLVQSWVRPTMPGVAPTSVLGLDQLHHPAMRVDHQGRAPPAGPSGGQVPTPPPAPAPAPAPSPAPSPAPRQIDVQNPAVVPAVASAMEGCTFCIAGLFNREHPPPKHDDGRDMCCAYHMRGRCSSTCSRSYSHTTLSDAEKTRLCTFVQERVVARNIGASA